MVVYETEDSDFADSAIRESGTKRSGAHKAHPHPSGSPEPSQADELITRRPKEALALIDIAVLDHLSGGFCSVTTAVKMHQSLGFHRINREHRIQ